jgi:metal-sulfur cluster biosynthetic enzyme
MAIHEKSDLQDGGQDQPSGEGAVSSRTAAQTDAPASGQASTRMPDEHEIMRALKAVYDPELGISIVDLGLVYGVNVDEGDRKVLIDMTLTTPACPLAPMIRTQAHAVLTSNFDAIRDVDVNLVWTPRWDPRTMASEEGKAELGIW